jgi:hypothetical protein
MAQRVLAQGPKAPILVRLNSGFDSEHITRGMDVCNLAGLPNVDWLIKPGNGS